MSNRASSRPSPKNRLRLKRGTWALIDVSAAVLLLVSIARNHGQSQAASVNCSHSLAGVTHKKRTRLAENGMLFENLPYARRWCLKFPLPPGAWQGRSGQRKKALIAPFHNSQNPPKIA